MSNDSTEKIVDDLRAWVLHAAPGTQVPSNRALVAQYSASPLTVQKAMHRLISLGLVDSRPGVGTFVRGTAPPHIADFGWQTAALRSDRVGRISATQRTTTAGAIRLHSGFPTPDLFPEAMVRSAFTRAARTSAALTAPPVGGLAELRSWFAADLAQRTAPGCAPATENDVVITPGSQSGVGSVLRSVVGDQRPVIVESPTYWGAIIAARQAGVRLVPIPSGRTGPDPDALDRAFRETGARAFYAQPVFANPTGGRWSASTRDAILGIVREHGAFLIEDDWAHDLGIDGDADPLAPHDDSGHIIYLRSLSKCASPALRVAAVIARGPVRERILADQAAESMYVSGLIQAAAFDVVSRPGWHTHLRATRRQLRIRRDLLLEVLARHVPDVTVESPQGGINLWVRLPDATDVHRLVIECEHRGLLVASGDEWFPAEPTGRFLRLGYAGEDPSRFDEGARILGDVLADLR